MGPRIQTDLQLVYNYEGTIDIALNGRAHRLAANEATLLQPGPEERFRFAEHGVTRHGWCNVLRPQLEPEFADRLNRLRFTYPFTARMKALAKMARPLQGAAATGLHLLRDTLVQALFYEFLQQTGILEEPHRPLHPAVERTRRFIQERYRESLDLKVIAAQAGITPAHLIRLSREQLQTTPMQLLWKTRTDAAAQLLRNTGLSAAEIAYETGFANPHHFSRLFKEQYGLPPRAWRLQEWAPRPPPGRKP